MQAHTAYTALRCHTSIFSIATLQHNLQCASVCHVYDCHISLGVMQHTVSQFQCAISSNEQLQHRSSCVSAARRTLHMRDGPCAAAQVTTAAAQFQSPQRKRRVLTHMSCFYHTVTQMQLNKHSTLPAYALRQYNPHLTTRRATSQDMYVT